MRFMLMMHAPRGTGDYQINSWSPDDLKAHIGFMHDFNVDLKKTGEFVDAQGLTPPGDAKLVRGNKNGVPETDGPFAESKEFLVGYWIIEVDKAERAYEIAAKVSSAPGPGGAPMTIPVEVRQIMSRPPDEL
jgi:hypothetical protein